MKPVRDSVVGVDDGFGVIQSGVFTSDVWLPGAVVVVTHDVRPIQVGVECVNRPRLVPIAGVEQN